MSSYVVELLELQQPDSEEHFQLRPSLLILRDVLNLETDSASGLCQSFALLSLLVFLLPKTKENKNVVFREGECLHLNRLLPLSFFTLLLLLLSSSDKAGLRIWSYYKYNE